MSSFCGNDVGTIPAMTRQEILTPFSMGNYHGLLGSFMARFDENGLVSEDDLQSQITKLKTMGIIPKEPEMESLKNAVFDAPGSKDPLASYTASEQDFQDKVKAEYCYYERQYFAALDSFLQGLADSSLRDRNVDIQNRLELARGANSRLNVFTQLVNAISKSRYSDATSHQTKINQLNGEFKTRERQIREQAAILNKETAAADVHRRMVDYTIEKNKANSNLLALYTFLNITAIGLLVYISRA